MPYPTPETTPRAAAGARFRAGLNIGMGIIYIILGAVTVSLNHFGTIELDPILAWALGGLFVLYGAFRIWRGFTDFKALRRGTY